jgi:hypothetical protein
MSISNFVTKILHFFFAHLKISNFYKVLSFYKVLNLCVVHSRFTDVQPQNYGLIHVNMTTCLLPSFITIVVATLPLESQHASNLKKEKYLDVHLNGYMVAYNCILHNTFQRLQP